MNLTTEQQSAANAIADFLASSAKEFVLTGYAGTGKTYTIGQCLGGKSVVYAAPTHKAVGVLRGSIPTGAEVKTIHSLLACKKHYDYQKGQSEFLPNYDKETASNYQVVVVDEASMIAPEMRSWLLTALHGSSTKIIWMGDPCQLPPVNDESIVFGLDCPGARLETIMRNGGDVQAAATRVRVHIGDARTQYAPDGVGVFNVSSEDFLNEYLKRRETAKMLAWTNSTVEWLNDWVREQLYTDRLPYHPGERLVVVDSWSNEYDTMMLHAEDELVAHGYTEGELHGLPCHFLDVGHEQYGGITLPVLNPSGKLAYSKRLQALKNQAKSSGHPSDWRIYFELSEAFIKVRPGWATTVHKSQGSTYQEAFVVQTNIKGCSDHLMRNMLTYVAYSRAQRELWLS
jgi:exodeoxyribonuclease-5